MDAAINEWDSLIACMVTSVTFGKVGHYSQLQSARVDFKL